MIKKIIFIVGESGCGKSTLQNGLIEKYPDEYTRIISTTTRNPREGETNGISYHFRDREEFEYLIKEKKLLQYTEFAGNYYGTQLSEYYQNQNSGIFVCTPIGITDTIKTLEMRGLSELFEFEIILFMTTNNLLKKHDIPKERIERGNILKDFMQMYVDNEFDNIKIRILRDTDVTDELPEKINNTK